ncbi:hypothetical protein RUM44_002667 [Polyplax serrata]|uniref:MACPF domain-containing protein n=1 Tax=Polyplax serrata TaxID=468196 RepID=A0ABR1AFE1_POLSC
MQRALQVVSIIMLLQTSKASGELHLGGAINLFNRYGYLSISMRVVPRNDTGSEWISREPTIDIFKDLSPFVEDAPREGKSKVFDGDFHMEFCDNLRQLLQAYFRGFSFERLDRPWRAFSGSWSRSGMSKHLGINQNYITGRYSYVLVRVARHRDTRRMKPITSYVELDEKVVAYIDDVRPGDEESVSRFIKKFGSHYIASYTTGNSLYQVFVFTPQTFERIKGRLRAKGISNMSKGELSGYFSPWYAEHIGDIKAASGNTSIQIWAAESLRIQFYFFTYPSLLKLHGNTELLRILNYLLGNEVLLSLDLKTIAPVFADPEKRKWFTEVVDNHLKLWETNMR